MGPARLASPGPWPNPEKGGFRQSDDSSPQQSEESVWIEACFQALSINAGAQPTSADVLTQALDRAIIEIEAVEMLCFAGGKRRADILGLLLEGVRRRLLAAQNIADELDAMQAEAAEYRVREALPWACPDAHRKRWLAP